MSEIDNLEVLIGKLKQLGADDLLKAEGQLEAVEEMIGRESPSVNQVLALSLIKLMRVTIKHVRVNEGDHLFMFELVLKQAKEIKTLNNIVVSLASERTGLKQEIEKLKKKQGKSDRLLVELDKIVEERRKFYKNSR